MAEPLHLEWRRDQVPQDLIELRNELRSLPHALKKKLLPLCERVGYHTQLQARLVKIAQEAVDQLQLDVKYLMFDLEATRRERDVYRQQLEELFD